MAKRKKSGSDGKNDNMVMVMTISLFIILLAFFILMNSIAVTDEKKKRVLVGSLVDSFGGESEAEPRGEFADDSFSQGVSPLDLSALSNENQKGMKDIRVTVQQNRTILSIPAERLFVPDESGLSTEGQHILDNLVDLIEKNPYAMDISVHTDNIPLFEKTGIGNTELTAIRSARILQYFVEKAGVPAERFTACGWGMVKPQEPNTTIEGRKLNRRVDLTFVHDKKMEKPKGYFIFKDFFFKVKEKRTKEP